MTDDSVKRGRIFNHRDGISELRRFDMEQNVKRLAEKIISEVDTEKSVEIFRSCLESLLSEAMEEYHQQKINASFDKRDEFNKALLAMAYTRAAEVARKHIHTIANPTCQCSLGIAAAIEKLKEEK